jgi:hypothetical protein
MFTPRLLKHISEIRQRVRNFKFERTPTGLYFPAMQAYARGQFREWVNDDLAGARVHGNLVVDQGLNYAIATSLLSGSQILLNSWFMALHAGIGPVLSSWTATNYTSNSSEITQTSPEGYSETNRQPWTGVADTGNTSADNVASPAVVTIVTAASLDINGAALISSNVRGGVSGTLWGAVVYATTRTLGDGDSYNVQYEFDLNTP